MINQNVKELELARVFAVEELEERMEFGRWSIETDASQPSRIEEVGCATITADI